MRRALQIAAWIILVIGAAGGWLMLLAVWSVIQAVGWRFVWGWLPWI